MNPLEVFYVALIEEPWLFWTCLSSAASLVLILFWSVLERRLQEQTAAVIAFERGRPNDEDETKEPLILEPDPNMVKRIEALEKRPEGGGKRDPIPPRGFLTDHWGGYSAVVPVPEEVYDSEWLCAGNFGVNFFVQTAGCSYASSGCGVHGARVKTGLDTSMLLYGMLGAPLKAYWNRVRIVVAEWTDEAAILSLVRKGVLSIIRGHDLVVFRRPLALFTPVLCSVDVAAGPSKSNPGREVVERRFAFEAPLKDLWIGSTESFRARIEFPSYPMFGDCVKVVVSLGPTMFRPER